MSPTNDQKIEWFRQADLAFSLDSWRNISRHATGNQEQEGAWAEDRRDRHLQRVTEYAASLQGQGLPIGGGHANTPEKIYILNRESGQFEEIGTEDELRRDTTGEYNPLIKDGILFRAWIKGILTEPSKVALALSKCALQEDYREAISGLLKKDIDILIREQEKANDRTK